MLEPSLKTDSFRFKVDFTTALLNLPGNKLEKIRKEIKRLLRCQKILLRLEPSYYLYHSGNPPKSGSVTGPSEN